MSTSLCRVAPFAVLALHCLAASAETAEAARQRETLLRPCTPCHGPAGLSPLPAVPHLVGQLPAYLVESIELLIAKKRPSTVPNHVPASWSSQQIETAASYYSAVEVERKPEATVTEKVEEGSGIARERCEWCHENGGRETDSKGTGSPILAGQHRKYLAEQIRAYLGGKRKFLTQMKANEFFGRPVIINGHLISERKEKLDDTHADALAHYYASVLAADAEKKRGRRPDCATRRAAPDPHRSCEP